MGNQVYRSVLKCTLHVEYNICIFFLTSVIFFFLLLVEYKRGNTTLSNLLFVGKDTEVFHGIFCFDIVTDLRLAAFVCHLETEISTNPSEGSKSFGK